MNPVGRLVMKDFDGHPIPVENRDNHYLVDTKQIQQPQINTDEELKTLIDFTKHYSQDIPYSFWVEKQNHGCYYNSKIADESKAFTRNNDFLKQFHDYTHKKL